MLRSSFLIRGHHLNLYAELASLRSDPRDLASVLVEGRLRDSEGTPEKQAYAQDVIGISPEQAKLVATRYRDIFTQFIELARDDLVVITTGDKDHICNSCIIGNHCSDRGMEMAADTDQGTLQVFEQDLEDMHSIQAFKKLAGRLAMRGELASELGTYSISDIPQPTPEAIPVLEHNMIEFEPPLQATAGYVKAVLAHWSLAQGLRY